MANLFSSVTVRANGQKILYSWFNALRTAGISVESFLGAGYVEETSFTFANGQSSAANVTGLSFSSSSYKSVEATVAYRRKTDSSTAFGIAKLYAFYRDDTAAWDLDWVEHGDPSGITFSITSGGQIQYVTDNMSGSNYSGASRFKASTFGT